MALVEVRVGPPGAPRGRHRQRWLRLAGLITGAVLVLAAAILLWPGRSEQSSPSLPAATTNPSASVSPIWARPQVGMDELIQRAGVTITQVAVTGGGGLVDLRYRVIDPNAAASLHDPATPPALIDEQSGLVVRDLVMNHSHTGPFHQGETYYLVFENPDNWIHRGSKVTVLLGAVEVRRITVA